ncbi:MAG: PqqD family protein [Candidatus Thermoplasmatota archaeon]
MSGESKIGNQIKVMNAKPVRQPVNWELEDGKVVIVVKKHFTKLERLLQKYLKGPENVRIPLDSLGSAIWLLCDGKHTIKEICEEMHKNYKEKIEPVAPRVTKFLVMLLRRNFIRLEK